MSLPTIKVRNLTGRDIAELTSTDVITNLTLKVTETGDLVLVLAPTVPTLPTVEGTYVLNIDGAGVATWVAESV
jgi:hypothetical protein